MIVLSWFILSKCSTAACHARLQGFLRHSDPESARIFSVGLPIHFVFHRATRHTINLIPIAEPRGEFKDTGLTGSQLKQRNFTWIARNQGSAFSKSFCRTSDNYNFRRVSSNTMPYIHNVDTPNHQIFP